MELFITAGNTQTPIDRVRCITNIFTGRTGASIALEAYRRGHGVTLVTSHPEVLAGESFDAGRWRCLPYCTFDDLAERMATGIAGSRIDAIVHCAAVSDYHSAGIFAPTPGTTFDAGIWRSNDAEPAMIDRAAGKIKSDEPELWLRLVRAPKLVDKIRSEWSFAGILVKFKLEVGVSEAELIRIAERSRAHSTADWMVANTLEGAADWAYVGFGDSYRKVTRAELPGAVLNAIETRTRHG